MKQVFFIRNAEKGAEVDSLRLSGIDSAENIRGKSEMKRLRWLSAIGLIFLAVMTNGGEAIGQERPNIILIMTDDQGYGDLGAHGNGKIRTPNIDRLAGESVELERFYVSPVCSPTRASLLTGRYNYRTGIVDTYLGRSMMHPDETTLAEMLASAGYRTGIYGKWHLGDNYPMRAMDQGFEESLVLNGGGIGQPSDPVGGESYFDPMLRKNGEWVKAKGYISDVITDGAIEFIGRNRNRPFFTYLAFNCPHTPLQVAEKDYADYVRMGLKPADFPAAGNPIGEKFDPLTTAKIYGMVENIDHNVGRLLKKLEELKLSEKTIVIFLTDNGPQQPRYNSGMRNLKGTVYEGGIRVPFYIRWKGRIEPARKADFAAAHIDVVPTLLDLAGIPRPAGVRFDGISLARLLKGEKMDDGGRSIFSQWHRGDAPEAGRAFAVRSGRYKLLQPHGAQERWNRDEREYLLFDVISDPFETKNIAADRPEIVEKLKKDYERWFADVTGSRNYAVPPRIQIGTDREKVTRLTRQDWRGPGAAWSPTGIGHWEVDVRRAGRYRITLRFAPLPTKSVAVFSFAGTKSEVALDPGQTIAVIDDVYLPKGEGKIEVFVNHGDKRVGALDVVVQ